VNFFTIDYTYVNKTIKTTIFFNFANDQFLYGLIISIIGLLSMSKTKYGGRMKLILTLFIFFIFQNIVWIIFTNIPT
jgi:hypothetical protein